MHYINYKSVKEELIFKMLKKNLKITYCLIMKWIYKLNPSPKERERDNYKHKKTIM